jgi:hypothetical protein
VGSSGRVLRLMTNSYFVGCSTGRSPGLAPLRMQDHGDARPGRQYTETEGGSSTPHNHDVDPGRHMTPRELVRRACAVLLIAVVQVDRHEPVERTEIGRSSETDGC